MAKFLRLAAVWLVIFAGIWITTEFALSDGVLRWLSIPAILLAGAIASHIYIGPATKEKYHERSR